MLGGSNGIASGSTSVSEGINTRSGGMSSHAEGGGTQALGDLSHAEGEDTIASNTAAHAEGTNTIASGNYSHAEGSNTTASGDRSHAEGYLSIASSTTSHAEGFNTISSGGVSHAEGSYTIASGATSHSEGDSTIAGGASSHAEGDSSIAIGIASHAEGYFTLSSGDFSHAEGNSSIASGTTSHAEGYLTIAGSNNSHAEGTTTTAIGEASHAEGNTTTSIGTNSHAEGVGTTSIGTNSHAEGNSTIASGDTSHAEGYLTIAGGDYSHSEGYQSTASGYASHVEGSFTTASGNQSHAEGYQTNASGPASHAEGSSTTASGDSSHTEGGSTIAYGNYSHAEGSSTIASGTTSHAEGYQSTASGYASHAEGNGSIASGVYSHAEGMIDSISPTIASGTGSHAEGAATLASGNYSHSEGLYTTASGTSSHAGGNQTTVNGINGFGHSAFSLIDVDSDYSSILGGSSHLINKSTHSSILGGDQNYITGNTGNNYNMILGGNNNIVYNHTYSTIINGSGNTIHFDLLDFSKPSKLEMIENSIDSVISASTLSKISSSNGMTISNSISSTVINSFASSFDPDPYLTSGGVIGTDTDGDNGVNTIISTYDGLIRYKAASNTIIGSTIARIDGTVGGVGGANSNFIGNSSTVTISDQYNTSGSSTYNTIFGSYASSMRTPNIYSTIMGCKYVGMEYSDTTSIISSKDSSILTGTTSSIIGGTGHTLTTTESSMILGGDLNTIDTSDGSIIAGGSGNTLNNVSNTVILGGSNITGTTSDTTYTTNLNIDKQDGLFGSKLGINTSSPQYVIDANGNSARLLLADTYTGADAPFKGFVFSGNSNNVPQIAASTSNISGGFGLALQMGVLGNNITPTSTTQLLGTLGDTYLVSSQQTNNLNIVNRNGGSGTNHIRMYAGVNSVTAAPNSDFHIQGDGATRGYIGIKTDNPEYLFDARGHLNNRFYYDPTFAGNSGSMTISATTGLPMFGVGTNTGVVNQNGSIGIGMRAWNDSAWATYGNPGDTHIYSSKQANGLVLISSDGVGTEDYIECYVGGDANGSGALAIHMHGLSGPTKGFVGFDTNLPTERLDVNGNGRFRSIGSTASAGALHYTSDGTLTTNTSDERLKTNITTLTGALSKVNQLRGVSYNWTENPTGDTRIGFIAQEVNSIVSELTFTNPNSPEQYMGVHYDNVTALLVESVKELFSGVTTSNNDFKPQTLTIPLYTPTSSNDTSGSEGNITRDDNYMYVKTITGWKRTNLENF